MAKPAIQAEIKSGTTHTVVWLPAELKPAKGLAVISDGKTVWEVVVAYPNCRQALDNVLDWRRA